MHKIDKNIGKWYGSIFLLIIIFLAGAFFTWFEAKEADQFMRSIMLSEANMLAKALDYRQIMNLTGTEADLLSCDYKYLNEQIIRIRNANPRYRYLYLMGKRKESPPFFFMGTEAPSSEYYSPPGQLYTEEAPTLAKVFALQIADVSNPVTDRWGTWISALVPIKKPDTGELIAVFGMDFDAGDWNWIIVSRMLSPIGITLFTALLFIALVIFLRYKQMDREKKFIAEAAKDLEKFFAVSPDILCIIDHAGNFKKINQSWEEILGFSMNETFKKNLLCFIHEEDKKIFDDIIHNQAKTDSQSFYSGRFKTKKEEYKKLEWRIEYHESCIYATARDITEKEKLQQNLLQATKMEAIGRLAGGVAHDFNNLLTAIKVNLDLAQMDLEEDSVVEEYLSQIQKAADSAASLTSQLLCFSRKNIIKPKIIDLNDILYKLYKMLKRLIGEDINLKVEYGKNLSSINMDPGQIEQVIVNLSVNARDAMEQGGILIIETANIELDSEYAQTHYQATPGKYVLLSVSDTGQGMTNETKKHLFEPFFTTKQLGKGTGLGLATIYGAIKQAGGFIEVYSEIGIGTIFKVYIPAVSLSHETSSLDMETSAYKFKGNETILLTEDEDMVRGMTAMILRRYGYNVLEASNGGEALEIAAQYKATIDILITDVVMPGMNGKMLATQIKARIPDMKILYTSGYTENVIVHHGVLEENVNFISKPFNTISLIEKIRSILDA